ncbi:MAG: hypothetical protein M3203_01420 [Actinomycetota bacterium]|nr:hypothetical protein [Actinomycetota bacterium]
MRSTMVSNSRSIRPPNGEQQVAAVLDLVDGIAVAEAAALLLVEVQAEAQAGLGTSPRSGGAGRANVTRSGSRRPRHLPGPRAALGRPGPHARRLLLPPYHELVGEIEASEPFHLARSLVDLIRAAPSQELASHTFSHYYCLEPGQDEAAFRADLERVLTHFAQLRDAGRMRSMTMAEAAAPAKARQS